jgi:hypothetical protein
LLQNDNKKVFDEAVKKDDERIPLDAKHADDDPDVV